MPLRVPEKISFLDAEISGLRTRIGTTGNAVQREKMEMLSDIRSDYAKSLEAVMRRELEEGRHDAN